MSTDKRTVATDALETLGMLINENCKRDAIHLAVEPCIAGERLYAGQHIGLSDGKGTAKADKKLGIVDPFLSQFVPEGGLFWLIVYPRQITSLRHVWEHPDFAAIEDVKPPLNEKETSEQWIKDFADKLLQHPDRLMEAADEWVEDEEYTYDNSETYKDYFGQFPEFWKHYEIITGKSPKSKSSFFTCSC